MMVANLYSALPIRGRLFPLHSDSGTSCACPPGAKIGQGIRQWVANAS